MSAIGDRIFISYSHRDEEWLLKLKTMLTPLIRNGSLTIFDDTNIKPGAKWRNELQNALNLATVAILLVSPDFLASDFIAEEELPPLLELAERKGLTVIWIPVRPCLVTETAISKYQAAIDPSKPLATLSSAEQEQALHKICEELAKRVRASEHINDDISLADDKEGPAEAPRSKTGKSKNAQPNLRVNFDHLIETHTHIFAGRSEQINEIYNFIATQSCGYVFIEALSGYGKTALLAKLARDNPKFAYHFISQAYKTFGSDFDPTEKDSLVANLTEQIEGETLYHDYSRLAIRFHQLLRASPVTKPLVIIIDGLDEINRHPNYLLGLLPVRLPDGIFMILSARKFGDHNYLHEIGLTPKDIGLKLELLGLNAEAISELLHLSGGQARALSDSKRFVKKLLKVSKGDPFYLRFLVEDIAQGVLTSENIDKTPSGLVSYLDMQLSILDRSIYMNQQHDIIVHILEVYGPLSRVDLIELVDGLTGLNFDNVVKDIRRYLLVYDDQYTFCHNRFKEYFASKVLR